MVVKALGLNGIEILDLDLAEYGEDIVAGELFVVYLSRLADR